MFELSIGSVLLKVVEFIFQFTSNWWKRPHGNCSPRTYNAIACTWRRRKNLYKEKIKNFINSCIFLLMKNIWELLLYLYFTLILIQRLSRTLFKSLQKIVFDLLWKATHPLIFIFFPFSRTKFMNINFYYRLNFNIDPGWQKDFSKNTKLSQLFKDLWSKIIKYKKCF